MTPDRYQKICEIFAEAAELPFQKRHEFLEKRCGDDAELRREVESLLISDENSGSFIDSPALEVAAEIMADDDLKTKKGLEIGQYKIISLLGVGGMGEVWLAEDSRLKRRVALKLFSAKHKQNALLRFEQEAYAASALNHPNIITIFDIGQNDGWQFIATEYIDGKTLRQILKERKLSLKECFDVFEQISAALAAAHSAGIVHRDIKPENIMIRADGILKILDFGLARFNFKENAPQSAKFLTNPGMILGTATYMSPEQARGIAIDEKTDVFSSGIVFYELLTGRQPFQGTSEIDVLAAILEKSPAEIREAVPESLRKLILRMLSKEAGKRPSAAEILEEIRFIKHNLDVYQNELHASFPNRAALEEKTVELTAVTGKNRRLKTDKYLKALKPAGKFNYKIAAAFLLLLSVFGFAFYRLQVGKNNAAVLTEADKLLIADFENKTDDEEFNDIFRQPLAVSLAQSPFISLIPDGQIRQTLREMEKPPTEKLSYEIAREVCQRRGVKAFLKGTIENYGVQYLITLEAFNAQTGESVALEKVSSANKETVIDSLGEASIGIREKLGESLASIEKFDTPLKSSTTSSLEALKLYSLATKIISEGKLDEAIALFKRAVEIDDKYASAYASLAAAYSNKGQMSVAAEYAEKAFQLRDRMTEKDKQKITGFYYVFVTGEAEKDIENLEIARQTYPRDSVNALNLGATYSDLGNFAKAEENARQAINLEPTLFYPYSNLGKYLIRQSRFTEAKAVFEDALNRKFENIQINTGLFDIAMATDDEAELQKQLEILKQKDPVTALKYQSNRLIFLGKVREYENLVSEAVNKSAKESPDKAADYAAQIALNFAALEKCGDARNWAEKALSLDRGQPILTDAALTSAMCRGQTEPLIAELKERFPKNTIVNSLWLPIIRAASEMESAPDRALEALEINRRYEGATRFWDNYLRGKIYLELGKADLATAEFEKILQNRGWNLSSPLYALSYKKLAEAYKMQSNPAKEEEFRSSFLKLWKSADKDLTALKNLPTT